jgi:cell fate regulator YaaT (PSP1 superfamily)
MTDEGSRKSGPADRDRRRRRRRRPREEAPGPERPTSAPRPRRDSRGPQAADRASDQPAGADAARGPRRRRRRAHDRKPREGQANPEKRPVAAAAAERTALPAAASDIDAGWDDLDEPSAHLAVTAATAVTGAAPGGQTADAGDDPVFADDDDSDDLPAVGEDWGDDDGAPTTDVVLAPDLPANPDPDDPDPATEVFDADQPADQAIAPVPEPTSAPVRNIVGIKFTSAGKIHEFDAGDHTYRQAEQVVVETERGTRVAAVAIASVRRPHAAGTLRRVLRRADSADLATLARQREQADEALNLARRRVRDRRIDVKVYRADFTFGGTKLVLYYSSERRVDLREVAREIGQRLRTRVEMRQTGVRDEAKLVGGIGSCGRELCCTTFLPAFAPVSIKMAKDQGLVLNPAKVSGQCGRLKCCLVYEQSIYAEMRKGLPKLGKRVITEGRGEGRVVEVDVLRQRIRVSFGHGDFGVYSADQVKPMFPSQQQDKTHQ